MTAPAHVCSLVVLFYDEAESIPHLLPKLDAAVSELRAQGHDVELIFVDDGSRDATADLLRAAVADRPHAQLVRLARNFGQTAALQAGIAVARGDVLVPMDGDLQNDPADVPRLVAKLDEGHDVVSGWRRGRRDRALSRRLPSWLANLLISRVSGVRLHDFGCTLKAYRSESLVGLRLYGEMHRFIPVYAAQRGARVTEMQIAHHARSFGRTKYGLGRVPNVLLDLLLVQFFWRYGTKPMHLFGRFGLLSWVASVACFALMIWYKLWGGKTFVETPIPLLVVMFFLIGCVSLLMGLQAEVTVRTYHEASNVSTYVVREILRGGDDRGPVVRGGDDRGPVARGGDGRGAGS